MVRRPLNTHQRMLGDNIIKMWERGVRLQGGESWSGEKDFVARHKKNPEDEEKLQVTPEHVQTLSIKGCVKAPVRTLVDKWVKGEFVLAASAAECLFGDDIDVFGVDEDKDVLLDRLTSILEKRVRAGYDLKKRYKVALEEYEWHAERGEGAVERLLIRMDELWYEKGGMIFGGSHYSEIKEALDLSGVNYVIVVDDERLDEINRLTK